ncbi:MAG: FAD-dependent oxidoreductase [Actinobacteria bacterium]|nr:FAD-dependent oxidoreductase [Actinomycetota bacterium]MDI6830806.1 FAD-dependent oxidoreductase [Actinomycetota bacterium]
MRRKGLLRFLLACTAWLALPVLAYFELVRWGALAGLAVFLLFFLLMPAGRRWGILQAFSLLFFLVAAAASLVLGKDISTRIPNLLAGGFACLTIMAGYGALEGVLFPAHYLYLDYPDSMRESPILRRAFWVLTLVWDGLFLLGLAANITAMLALRGDTSISVACIASGGIFAAGIAATPVLAVILPRRMEAGLVEKSPLAVRWTPTVLEPGRALRGNEYDAAVVGAGIGGLACASLLSHSGMRVLVAERSRLVGGYCQTYNWEGFPLNSGPTMLTGGAEGGMFRGLLARLGLEEEIPLRRLEWGLADGRIALRLGAGGDEDLDKLGKKFPSCRDGLLRLFNDLRRFRGEFRDRPDPLTSPLPSSLEEYHEQFVRHPVSALWQNLSFQDMLDEYLPGEHLASLLGKTASLLGGEAERFPAYEGARLLCALFIDGIYYPRRHFSHLSQRLAAVVRDAGGEVLTSCGAEEVLVKGEGAHAVPIGLRLADGTQVRSGVVVLDTDPRRAVSGLLQPRHLGTELLKEMQKLRPSDSAFVLHLVFQEDLRIPERVFYFPPRPRRVRTGDTYMSIDSIILSKEPCTVRSNPGYVLMARINVPGHCYHAFDDEAKGGELGSELTAVIKEEIAAILPAVKKAVREFVTTPAHFGRLTSNGQGCAFGFAPLVTQWYYRRPGPRLPLANLYLVGAWSRFGGGVEGALLSGVIAARELCGENPYGGALGTATASGAAEPAEVEERPVPGRFPRRRKKSSGGEHGGE